MGKFEKGKSGNPTGRPPGAKNRTHAQVQLSLLKLLDDNIDGLSADIAAMSPEKRANFLINLAKHVTPAALQPERLTVEQLEQVIEYLKKREDDEK